MSKKPIRPTERFHLMLYSEDLEWIRENFGPDSPRAYGTGAAIRDLIHGRVVVLREAVNKARDNRQAGMPGSGLVAKQAEEQLT